jgi:acyl-CoA synthetase (AMP-forming)/AMP-acid ligase II/acyl carrier protein
MESSECRQDTQGQDVFPFRLRQHARERPDTPILTFLDQHGEIQQTWTFREVDHRARAIAACLQQRGLAGQAVVLAYPSCLEFVSAFCGCLYAGAVAVPARLSRSQQVDERMSAILTDSGSTCVLTSLAHRPSIERQVAPGSGVEIIASDVVPDRSDDWSPVAWTGDQLAFLQYTSGSTRSPSGVIITHANLAANLDALRDAWCTNAGSVGVSWLPLFHDMGLIAGVLEPLWIGYPAYLMAPATFVQSPLRWLRAISRYRGTIGGGPNFAYQACADAARSVDTNDLDLSSWELAWNGAEPVRASTLEQFRTAFAGAGFRPESLTPGFGLAEATLLVTASNGMAPASELIVDESKLRNGRATPCTAESPHAKRLVSSGRPGPGTSVLIVNPDTHRETHPEDVGEIWVRSDSVGRGYWNKPEESLATFGARLHNGEGPFLRTGDLGFLHDGELFVTGRLKDVIVIRGANYYPHDIEHTVQSSHPALRPDAGAVVGLEEAGRVRLVALQEVRRDVRRTLDRDEVFLAIRRSVAREHQLALEGIVLVKPFCLPKTSSGKVQRSRCRSAVQERILPIVHEWWASSAHMAPIRFTGELLSQPGVLERQLVDWLQRELSLPHLGWKTPLMELGIDSLKGVELGNALSAAFNYSFSATLLIDHPTVESLARLIRDDVLGTTPVQLAVSAWDAAALEISALGESDLDARLRKSIDEVLKRGGRS